METTTEGTPPAGPVPARITVDWLEDHEACAEGIDDFVRAFDDGVADLTRANLMQAAEADLDVAFLAETLLDAHDHEAFARATLDHDVAYASALGLLAAGAVDFNPARDLRPLRVASYRLAAAALADRLGLP